MYIYERKDWPNFKWDEKRIPELLIPVRHRHGRLLGKMENLGFSLRSEAILKSISLEVIKSSDIEGEILDSDQVRSSIARHLGMKVGGLVSSDRNVDGIVELMLDAIQKYDEELSADRLFHWHSLLFPVRGKKKSKVNIGSWRTSALAPMQVISGSIGREKVHFEAPKSKVVAGEMKAFLKWFNSELNIDPVLNAAIAHLWFVTVHPFVDGNGRIARAIADMQLVRADGISQRFYSMSAQIRLERKSYYNILEKTQKGTLDITEWLIWFIACFDKTLSLSETTLEIVITKSNYLKFLNDKSLNDRQRILINKLLDGFEGKLNSSKWAKIAKCSQDTALRDIQVLLDEGVLEKEGAGGRSTSYRLKDLEADL